MDAGSTASVQDAGNSREDVPLCNCGRFCPQI